MNRFIDIKPSRCIACGTCQTACSEGHRRAGFQKEPRLTVVQNREVAASITCHHCEGAPCLKVCPVNAIRQDPDGCIRVDEVHCLGCKMCAIACPFGAIHMSGTPRAGYAGIEYLTSTLPDSIDPILRWEIGYFPVAVKCDLCEYNDYHPKCVEACPTEALILTEIEEDFINEKNRRAHRSLEAEVVMFENMDRAQASDHHGLAEQQFAAMEAMAKALEKAAEGSATEDSATADPQGERK